MSRGRLERWLRKESVREQRRVTLEDALVFGGVFRYMWQRSRRFVVTRAVQESLHIVELCLLFLFASQDAFVATAVVSIGARVAGSAWWGGLELLRNGVRDRASDGRYIAIGPLIRKWLIGSGAVGLVLCCTGVSIAAATIGTTGYGIVGLYLAVRLFGFGLELPVRTLHSGAYALRRIYQPTWALLMPSVTRGALLLGLWPLFDVWSVPAASGAAVVVSAALTSWFTRNAYVELGWWPLARDRHRFRVRGFVGARDVWRFAAAALANTTSGAGHLWTLALLSLGAVSSDLWLALFVYVLVVGPMFDACLAWARLFYPDLASLDRDLLSRYRRLFERELVRWSPLVGTVVWLPTLALVPLLPGGHAVEVAAATWLLFVTRACFAAIQIVAFSNGRFVALSLLSLSMAAGVAAASWSLSGWAAWAMGGIVMATLLFKPGRSGRSSPRGVVPIASLVAAAPCMSGQGIWIVSEFRPGKLLHGWDVLLQRAARRSGAIGIERGRVLLRWQPSEAGHARVANLLHGFERLRWRSSLGSAVDGLKPCERGWPDGEIPSAKRLEAVVSEFRERFPTGFWARAGEPLTSEARRLLSWRERELVLDLAVGHVFGRPSGAILPVDVSALSENGELAALFLIRRDASPGSRRNWRRRLRRLGIANALASSVAPATGTLSALDSVGETAHRYGT